MLESLTSRLTKFEPITSADDMLAIQVTGTFKHSKPPCTASESIDSKYRVEFESEWLKLLHLSTDQYENASQVVNQTSSLLESIFNNIAIMPYCCIVYSSNPVHIDKHLHPTQTLILKYQQSFLKRASSTTQIIPVIFFLVHFLQNAKQ